MLHQFASCKLVVLYSPAFPAISGLRRTTVSENPFLKGLDMLPGVTRNKYFTPSHIVLLDGGEISHLTHWTLATDAAPQLAASNPVWPFFPWFSLYLLPAVGQRAATTNVQDSCQSLG